MPRTSLNGPSSQDSPEWHARFLAMLPAIERYARRAFGGESSDRREEAVQAVVASAVVAYARLAALDKPELGRATPLANYGVKHYRAGRLVGSSVNGRDVGSAKCRLRGCVVTGLDEFQEAVCASRRATPADIAALRIDLEAWFSNLSTRDQQLAVALAQGEPTSGVAQMFRVTAGRVSQLRQELYHSWLRFTGDTAVA